MEHLETRGIRAQLIFNERLSPSRVVWLPGLPLWVPPHHKPPDAEPGHGAASALSAHSPALVPICTDSTLIHHTPALGPAPWLRYGDPVGEKGAGPASRPSRERLRAVLPWSGCPGGSSPRRCCEEGEDRGTARPAERAPGTPERNLRARGALHKGGGAAMAVRARYGGAGRWGKGAEWGAALRLRGQGRCEVRAGVSPGVSPAVPAR